MTTTLKHVAAAFAFAGSLATGFASAHVMDDTVSIPGTISLHDIPDQDIPSIHRVQAPPNLRVEGAPGLSHTAAVVSWDEAHSHTYFRVVLTDGDDFVVKAPNPTMNFGYWVTLRTTPLPTSAGTIDRCIDRSVPAPAGCIRGGSQRRTFRGTDPLRTTVHDLTPETTYYVHVAGTFEASGKRYASAGTTTTFTTAANPDGTEPVNRPGNPGDSTR